MNLTELHLEVKDPRMAENLRILIAAHALDFRKGTIEIAYDDQGKIRRVTNHIVSFTL